MITGICLTTSLFREISGSSINSMELPSSNDHKIPIRRNVPSENCSSVCHPAFGL